MSHYIIVKFKPDVDWKELLGEIEELFHKTLLIKGVEKVEVIPSCSERENRYHLMIKLELSAEGLKRYDVSESHVFWKEKYGSLIESKAIFDCETVK
ncbi:MAG: Dabb family protein [Parasporobacterium sp.]|nr:Dabb family protein [Parasporobacterium sp.]